MRSTIKWTDAMYALLLKKHRAGARQVDLARMLRRSRERIRQALRKAERLEQRQQSLDPLERLSMRTKNALRSDGFISVESVRVAIATGAIDNIPNLGKIGKREVVQWLADLGINGDGA